jgi:hypothetical protein
LHAPARTSNHFAGFFRGGFASLLLSPSPSPSPGSSCSFRFLSVPCAKGDKRLPLDLSHSQNSRNGCNRVGVPGSPIKLRSMHAVGAASAASLLTAPLAFPLAFPLALAEGQTSPLGGLSKGFVAAAASTQASQSLGCDCQSNERIFLMKKQQVVSKAARNSNRRIQSHARHQCQPRSRPPRLSPRARSHQAPRSAPC